MTPEWLASKTNQELKDWISHYEEELTIIRCALNRRLLNENR